MRRLSHAFWTILAAVFLVEAWLWERLAPIVARVVAILPLRALKRAVVRDIDTLPPPAALVVFLIPLALLFPLKLVALWLIARHHWLMGASTFLFAKMVGLGVTAFIFDATRDKLLQMAWFRRAYAAVLRLRDWARVQVDPAMRRLRRLRRMVRPGRAGRFLKHAMRLRRRMRAAA